MNNPRLALFVRLPGPLMVPLNDHVNPLYDKPVIISGKGNNTLQPQDIGPVGLGQFVDPWEKFLMIHFPGPQRNRRYRHVMGLGVKL